MLNRLPKWAQTLIAQLQSDLEYANRANDPSQELELVQHALEREKAKYLSLEQRFEDASGQAADLSDFISRLARAGNVDCIQYLQSKHLGF